MISESSKQFLLRLLDTPGPSGFEAPAARVWREEAARFASDVTADVAGNSLATINPDGRPTVMIDGHIDEIGLIIQYIDDEGFLYVSAIGGWDAQVLPGQRVRILARDGSVSGVIGKKPIHLIKGEEKEKAVKITDLWVDIGARDRAGAESRVAVGDPMVIDSRTLLLDEDRVVSRSIDDRIGAFVALEALRRYAERPGAAKVVAAATTQEEIGYLGGGALVCAQCVNPRMAIVVDVTFATDHPSIEKKEVGDHRLGGGPVLSRGALISPVAFALLRETAESRKIPFSVHAVGKDTATNADAIHIAREGVATALVSIPNRYMHSPNEMISLADVDRAAELIAEVCRRVGADTDFTAR